MRSLKQGEQQVPPVIEAGIELIVYSSCSPSAIKISSKILALKSARPLFKEHSSDQLSPESCNFPSIMSSQVGSGSPDTSDPSEPSEPDSVTGVSGDATGVTSSSCGVG